MKRISTQEVLEAYAKTGLRPKRGDFYDGCGCGCPITALYVATTGERPTPRLPAAFGHQAALWADTRFGVDYKSGFIRGFDNCQLPSPWHGQRQSEGMSDGEAVRRAVEEAGLMEPSAA